jgi:hypothetical protein
VACNTSLRIFWIVPVLELCLSFLGFVMGQHCLILPYAGYYHYVPVQRRAYRASENRRRPFIFIRIVRLLMILY